MENNLFSDARYAVMCSMLFTMIVAVTAETPAAVPAVFSKIWRQYMIFQETRKTRASGTSAEKFWEIDMTKFEP